MAIHEQNYIRYQGPMREGSAIWVIAWSALRTYISSLRTKLILLFLLTMPLITLVLIVLEYTARMSFLKEVGVFQKAPDPYPVMIFARMQYYSLVLLFAASGCGVISDDLRYKTFQLYFSKPLTRKDYAFGKFLSLYLLGALITIIPALLLTAARSAMFIQAGHLTTVAFHMGAALVLSSIVVGVMSILLMGLSSLSQNTRYVVLMWLGVIIVPTIVGVIVGAVQNSVDMINIFSMTGSIWLIAKVVIQNKSLEVPTFLPFLVLASYGGLGFYATKWRLSKLEGVA